MLMVALPAFTLPLAAQNARVPLEQMLTFEAPHAGDMPGGWGGAPVGTIFVDSKVVHGGKQSVRLERDANSPNAFTTVTSSLPLDFTGSNIELRGFIRTEDVTEYASLWMREDGPNGSLAFDNMQRRAVKGTTPWTEYSIVLPLRPAATRLYFGFLFSRTGKAWADDLELLVDGKPISAAPKTEKTVLDTDHEFDFGSNVVLTELSKAQIENLATLGRVWGFLKYHHPLVTSGRRHWDYDLFRVMPAVLKARDRAEANKALSEWIRGLGEVSACNPCAALDESNLQTKPDVGWIGDDALLGAELSASLRFVYKNRASDAKQFYVSKNAGIGNPQFDHELAYPDKRFPDAGYRLLALYRLWNIVEYHAPDRNVIDEDLAKVLAEFIPKIGLAKDADEYQRELFELIGHVHDTHANLWSSMRVQPPVGGCMLPVEVRFIEGQAVVAGAGGGVRRFR
jgi:hypothetical protein